MNLSDMKKVFIGFLFLINVGVAIAQPDQIDSQTKVMDGFPPTRESQVTLKNYRTHPYSQWSFRNTGAPLHVIMVPRWGCVFF
jgi:hypothetical protein